MMHIPNLLFIFGLAGAGKTYVGNLLAKELGYFAYDFDQDLTPAMKEAIAKKEAFTESMRDEYFQKISLRIAELQRDHPKLLCMQAAYKQRHRDALQKEYPEICFVWVRAETDLMADRLRKRGDAISPDFAARIAQNFETPKNGKIIENNSSDAELLKQFSQLFQSEKPASSAD